MLYTSCYTRKHFDRTITLSLISSYLEQEERIFRVWLSVWERAGHSTWPPLWTKFCARMYCITCQVSTAAYRYRANLAFAVDLFLAGEGEDGSKLLAWLRNNCYSAPSLREIFLNWWSWNKHTLPGNRQKEKDKEMEIEKNICPKSNVWLMQAQGSHMLCLWSPSMLSVPGPPLFFGRPSAN